MEFRKSEVPTQFVPPHADNSKTRNSTAGLPDYAPNDLSFYANIPVPTSYMCMGSQEDFFGGYDFKAQAGIVHLANHHIAPGKKQWTWGNHEFGYAWDRNLTDPDARGEFAPYIEIMAGVYTDNQPDFSFLQPGETKIVEPVLVSDSEDRPGATRESRRRREFAAWRQTVSYWRLRHARDSISRHSTRNL